MLSPVDIQNKEFKKSKIGGYNIDDVNDFLDQILKAYQDLINENYALKDKINVLDESVQYYRTMESTIQNVLVLADKTAQETKGAAYEKADQVKKEAEQRAEKITALAEERVERIVEQGRQEAFELSQRTEEIRRQYFAYKTQFKQLLQSQSDLLEQGDLRMKDVEPDFEQVFADIEKDVAINPDEFKPVEPEDEEAYTKEYVPIAEPEEETI